MSKDRLQLQSCLLGLLGTVPSTIASVGQPSKKKLNQIAQNDTHIEKMSEGQVLDEDDVSCAICLEIWTLPTCLQCLHAFCRPCLLALGGAGLCPLCRHPFALPLPPVKPELEAAVAQYRAQQAALTQPSPPSASPPPFLRRDEWVLICRFLERLQGPAAVARLGAVCRGLHRVAADPYLWREWCIRDFCFVPEESEGVKPSWRRRYDGAKKQARGWSEGRPQDWTVTSLRGPPSHVVQIRPRPGHRMSVRYADGSCQMWDTRTKQVSPDDTPLEQDNDAQMTSVDAQRSLRLRDGNVQLVEAETGVVLAQTPLAPGSNHNTVPSYHLGHAVIGGSVTAVYTVALQPPSVALKAVLMSPSPSNCVHITQRRVVSGHADQCIRVWDIEQPQKPLYCLLGGSLRPRPDNPAHPTRPGCSMFFVDQCRIVAAFGAVVKCFALAGGE